jgi:hypothetical protein
MDPDDKDRSGYYRTIARAFLERRGAPLLLSPRDQALVADWEARDIPLRVVLEAIGRAFEALRERGRGTRGVSLAFCARHVDEAFAQHRDRGAGGRAAAAAPRPDKRERARREIEAALAGLPPDEARTASLLKEALAVLEAPRPDESALERIDAEVEEHLWSKATVAERAAAEAEARRDLRGVRTAGLAEAVRRTVVRAARSSRRVPYVSLHHH